MKKKSNNMFKSDINCDTKSDKSWYITSKFEVKL